jgi:hypothetical protein
MTEPLHITFTHERTRRFTQAATFAALGGLAPMIAARLGYRLKQGPQMLRRDRAVAVWERQQLRRVNVCDVELEDYAPKL